MIYSCVSLYSRLLTHSICAAWQRGPWWLCLIHLHRHKHQTFHKAIQFLELAKGVLGAMITNGRKILTKHCQTEGMKRTERWTRGMQSSWTDDDTSMLDCDVADEEFGKGVEYLRLVAAAVAKDVSYAGASVARQVKTSSILHEEKLHFPEKLRIGSSLLKVRHMYSKDWSQKHVKCM